MANKRILKDVAKLSPHHQTSSLEAFHSVILRFAPKNIVFPFLGMLQVNKTVLTYNFVDVCNLKFQTSLILLFFSYHRLYLTAMSYNENSN